MSAQSKSKGFTLVEILIVVIILGILAAIVIPQFTNASQDARNSSLTATLGTLRSQIQLYKLNHGDQLPDLTGNWNALTTATTFGGASFGPYLQAVPVNPLNNYNTVVDGTASSTISTGVGFVYDYNSGNGTGRIYGTDPTGTTLAGTGSGANFVPY